MSVSGSPDDWRKASYSQPSENCVEVAVGAPMVGVRDTKDRAGGQLSVPGAAWRALLGEITRD